MISLFLPPPPRLVAWRPITNFLSSLSLALGKAWRDGAPTSPELADVIIWSNLLCFSLAWMDPFLFNQEGGRNKVETSFPLQLLLPGLIATMLNISVDYDWYKMAPVNKQIIYAVNVLIRYSQLVCPAVRPIVHLLLCDLLLLSSVRSTL